MPKRTALILAAALLAAPALVACTENFGITYSSVQVVDLNEGMWVARPTHVAFRVNFSTNIPLSQEVRNFGYYIFARASICYGSSFDKTRELQADTYVFNTAGVVDPIRGQDSGNNNYYFNFFVRSEPLAGRADVFTYDLEQRSENICLFIGGENAIDQSIFSNTIVVSMSDLSDAIFRWTKERLQADDKK